MKIHKTNNANETQSIAEEISKSFKGGAIALSGELGAGKTTFVQGFAKGLGIKEKIISPTFLIIRQYPFSGKYFYHIDLYRIEEADLDILGLKEILEDEENIILIEWPERLKNYSGYKMKIDIKNPGGDFREITVNG
jgi:tRNA threonylcarbamoyladenosine biosynthesis protein TsaE